MEKIKNVDVLITTMKMNSPIDLIKRMNIDGHTMIGNQTDYNKVETFLFNGHEHQVYSFNEKGVGLNRNNLLMRSNADYCLFGDDDLVYVDDYEELVIREFEKHPDADVLVFNLSEENSKRFQITKEFKVNYFNFMRFGAARIAIRRESIVLNGIFYNLCFGGGTSHNHGEDTLFLSECLNKKLNIYALPLTIASLTETRDSTWFKGYNDKYFMDKGVLYYLISRKYYRFLCLQDAVRHHNTYSKPVKDIVQMMLKGVKNEIK